MSDILSNSDIDEERDIASTSLDGSFWGRGIDGGRESAGRTGGGDGERGEKYATK